MSRRSSKNSKRRRKLTHRAHAALARIAKLNSRDTETISEQNGADPEFAIANPKDADWAGVEGVVGTYIGEECGRTLQSYRAQPNYVLEHAKHEQDTARGGYADRQLFELVQNGADALSKRGGRIEIRITNSHLYCADSGEAIDTDGVKALTFSYLSPKRGTSEIGRFGLGFKSVLGVSNSPEFFSRSGSFRFDRIASQQMIQRQMQEQVSERYPVLRLAIPIDPRSEAGEDPVLRGLMMWANNIVRLPLVAGAYQKLESQAEKFPAEFLLFARHVERLDIRVDDADLRRTVTLFERDGTFDLSDGADDSRWRVFHRIHLLSSEARADSRALDAATEVPIWWATPLEGSNPAGHFWAFFPTSTPSLVPGILNAPWKTNEDRQNLLTGVYNDELVRAAAELIADNLHHLSTPEDPAKHLDALPRRVRQVDRGHTVALSNELFRSIYRRPLMPDASGVLRRFDEIRFPPEIVMRRRRGYDANLDAALDRWFSCSQLPDGWLHETATSVSRWPFVERLCDPAGLLKTERGFGTPLTTVPEWLQAIVETATPSGLVEASMAAILVAADLPKQREFNDVRDAGVVLTQNGTLVDFTGDVFLPTDGFNWSADRMVHESLSNDAETRRALSFLGVKEASAETRYELLLDSLFGVKFDDQLDPLGNYWQLFWRACRGVNPEIAVSQLMQRGDWRHRLRLRTVSGEWRPVSNVLMPGVVVPADGTRDSRAIVDLDYHREDGMFFQRVGLSDRPTKYWQFGLETDFLDLVHDSVDEYQRRGFERIGQNPQPQYVKFNRVTGVGPTDVLIELSVKGKSAFTEIALPDRDTFAKWTMSHSSRREYGVMETYQPIISAIAKHGMIETTSGIVPFAEALGKEPANREAQRILLDHANVDLIREAFDLHDPPRTQFVPVNSSSSVSIADAWPSLVPYLSVADRSLKFSRCDDFIDETGDPLSELANCDGDTLFVVRMDREDELDAICCELNVRLEDRERRFILNRIVKEEITAARNAVRAKKDDESRLLQAVGEDALLSGLPQALTEYYNRNGHRFEGEAVAKAVISTFHTGALKEYRHALAHLDPPRQWAGSSQAIQFVTELGFAPEWAGERGSRRDPFLEVPGPIVLPPLHDYQNIVANKLRQMLRSSERVLTDRRAMISLPTGSGKTRVAVEGTFTSITEDGFHGGVLWVADRDELCEQAVQSWQEVWRAKGKRDQILRVSRMWEGQPPPLATNENHVVVASVQTLSSKLNRNNADYDFLRDFKLIVFDEAHRSVAPTYTSAIDELGFRSRSGDEEPLLLGLTATPYRGYSESETSWLARRYGQNRLDRGAFFSEDANLVMRQLQEMTILARATHMEIEGGSFSLYGTEIAEVERAPWLPNSVENRIARDAERTERIIRA